ncbi:MAG TPA: RHS repeat-associated core domain-containing protein [Terriglobales bacterium]|nr:RHS repeat-associated core domain-containing protein [Terriglobales bacterium]
MGTPLPPVIFGIRSGCAECGGRGNGSFTYDAPNLLEEVDSSGNVLARYTQSGLIDEPLSELRSGTTSYYEQDGINAVSSLSNSAGALANTYTYDSFGKLTASSGTLANPFQYTSREFDPETGLLNYRARYYDATTGRFLSEDPVHFNGGGVNFYEYVYNRPTTLVDPTGLAAQCKNCRIVVRCRGIESYHLGLAGFQHCDAQVVDENGKTHSLSGGPDPTSNGELLNAWNTTENLPPFTGDIIYYNARANCDTANCLVNSTIAFHNDRMRPAYIPYGGPNSNTWLDSAFGGCGIHLNLHWWGPPIFQLPFWQGK